MAADVAVAADGSYVVASLQLVPSATGTTPTGAVTAVRYAPSGEQIGPSLTLDSTATLSAGVATVSASVDADGDAVVAYEGEDGVYVVRVSRVGVASVPQRVDTAPAGVYRFSPSVSMDDAGRFFVGWVERGEDTDSIRIRAYDAAGAPRGPQFVADSVSDFLYGLGELDIAADPGGSGAVIAYDAYAYEGSGSVAFARVSTTALVAELGRVGSFDGDVAVHRDGSFVIAYEYGSDQSAISPTWVRAQRYDAAGAAVGAPIDLDDLVPVGSGRDPRTHSVSVDVTPDGGFVAAFVHTVRVGRSINPDRDFNTMYARRYAADGSPDASGLVVLDDPPYDSHSAEERYLRPTVGVDGFGTTVVIHQEPTRLFDTYAAPVRYHRLAGDIAINDRGDVYVFGADAGESIRINPSGSSIVVNIDGNVRTFAAADVKYLSINGFGGDDDIDVNTTLPATIHGGDGSDTIWGGTGDDRIRGQGGDDVLRGGDGNDHVLGESGSDDLHGGDGNDAVWGDAGEDTLVGANGNDSLVGHRGSDRMLGEGGNDALDGGEGNDYLEGGAGHDLMIGGNGADALFGLAGNDRFFASGDALRDTVRGGVGTDTADADDLDDVTAVETTA